MRAIVINEGARSSVEISDTRRIETDFDAALMRVVNSCVCEKFFRSFLFATFTPISSLITFHFDD